MLVFKYGNNYGRSYIRHLIGLSTGYGIRLICRFGFSIRVDCGKGSGKKQLHGPSNTDVIYTKRLLTVMGL
jgi:hypothetical protein